MVNFFKNFLLLFVFLVIRVFFLVREVFFLSEFVFWIEVLGNVDDVLVIVLVLCVDDVDFDVDEVEVEDLFVFIELLVVDLFLGFFNLVWNLLISFLFFFIYFGFLFLYFGLNDLFLGLIFLFDLVSELVDWFSFNLFLFLSEVFGFNFLDVMEFEFEC